MVALLVVPFVVQGMLMAVDELHFHRRRGLPRWERLGHPLDTLTVVATYAFALASDPARPWALAIYVGMALFSCVFVTKDEPVHARCCSPGEQWLHAMLFVFHPVVFLAFGLLWRAGTHETILWVQLVLTVLFGLYQLGYWSLPWRARSTTPSTRA